MKRRNFFSAAFASVLRLSVVGALGASQLLLSPVMAATSEESMPDQVRVLTLRPDPTDQTAVSVIVKQR